MAVRLLAAADRRPVPWKNGGGVTTEVAAHPPGAGFDDFDWRVSLAQVASDGPFSMFPDIDRTLVVLEGGVRLSVEGRAPVELAPASAPYAFPGEAPAAAELLAGPALDLNVMVRRGRLTADVTALTLPGDIPVRGRHTLLIVTEGEARLTHPDGELVLARFDAIELDDLSEARLSSDLPGRAYLVAFGPAE